MYVFFLTPKACDHHLLTADRGRHCHGKKDGGATNGEKEGTGSLLGVLKAKNGTSMPPAIRFLFMPLPTARVATSLPPYSTASSYRRGPPLDIDDGRA